MCLVVINFVENRRQGVMHQIVHIAKYHFSALASLTKSTIFRIPIRIDFLGINTFLTSTRLDLSQKNEFSKTSQSKALHVINCLDSRME